MDRMRESLFAILGDVSSCSFLDLFSGSGSVGLEAASRCAEPVVFVEKDRRKKPFLHANLAACDLRCRVAIQPVERFVRFSSQTWDFIFADPPFAYRFKCELLAQISDAGMLERHGVLIMHSPKSENLPPAAKRLRRIRSRDFGQSRLHFYRICDQ